MDVALAGGKVNAAVIGEGRSIVLLHSLLADRASFDRIELQLSKRFRVVIPELPGFGLSAATEGGIASVAERIAEAVRDICPAERPILLGNGYGGFVALQLAILYPEIASRLVLADCGAKFSEEGAAAFRSMEAASKAKGLGVLADTAMLRLFAPDFQAANPSIMNERRAAFLATDLQVFQSACAALAQLDLRGLLENVSIPVLVLVGEKDEATPPFMSRELAAGLPNARLTILPGCAHVPQLQSPEMFLDAVFPFLEAAD